MSIISAAEFIKKVLPEMDGWCSPEKGIVMADAVFYLKCDLSVELGVFGGRGLLCLAIGHQASGVGKAWGFDPWTKEAALEGENSKENDAWWSSIDLERIYRDFVANMVAKGVLETCNWARLRSDQAVKLFEDESVGVIHADSNHSEKISCDEVERWVPKLKKGGLWFADDIDWPSTKKAQKMLIEAGLQLEKSYDKWAIYQKIK